MSKSVSRPLYTFINPEERWMCGAFLDTLAALRRGDFEDREPEGYEIDRLKALQKQGLVAHHGDSELRGWAAC